MENEIDLRDFIDPDEGYRDTDWDSHLRSGEPFYAEALPCESCGKPCDSRKQATWDQNLLVGPCCEIADEELPDEPVCPNLHAALMRSDSVAAVSLAFAVHLAECPACQRRRKQTIAARPVRVLEAA